MSDFDTRPREVTCSAKGCETVTATYQDLNPGEPIRFRLHICEEHAKQRDAGEPFLIDFGKVEGWWDGNGPTLLERALMQVGELSSAVAQRKAEIANTQKALAETRATVAIHTEELKKR